MADLALRYSPELGGFDLVLDTVTGDLVMDDGLTTAVILSLFTDRRALPGDAGLPSASDRRGWWGDALTPEAPLGSRLWLLAREKTTAETAARVRTYVREALEWMLRAGVATRLTVTAEAFPADGRVEVAVAIDAPGEDTVGYRWRNVWEPQSAV